MHSQCLIDHTSVETGTGNHANGMKRSFAGINGHKQVTRFASDRADLHHARRALSTNWKMRILNSGSALFSRQRRIGDKHSCRGSFVHSIDRISDERTANVELSSQTFAVQFLAVWTSPLFER